MRVEQRVVASAMPSPLVSLIRVSSAFWPATTVRPLASSATTPRLSNSPSANSAPFAIHQAPDARGARGHDDRAVLRQRQAQRLEQLVAPVVVLGRIVVLDAVAGRQLRRGGDLAPAARAEAVVRWGRAPAAGRPAPRGRAAWPRPCRRAASSDRPRACRRSALAPASSAGFSAKDCGVASLPLTRDLRSRRRRKWWWRLRSCSSPRGSGTPAPPACLRESRE